MKIKRHTQRGKHVFFRRSEGMIVKITEYPGGGRRIEPMSWNGLGEYVDFMIERLEKKDFNIKGGNERALVPLRTARTEHPEWLDVKGKW